LADTKTFDIQMYVNKKSEIHEGRPVTMCVIRDPGIKGINYAAGFGGAPLPDLSGTVRSCQSLEDFKGEGYGSTSLELANSSHYQKKLTGHPMKYPWITDSP
jgi:hypothetical protein